MTSTPKNALYIMKETKLIKRFKMKIPMGVDEIEATSRKEAIDKAMKMYLEGLQKIWDNGNIYAVPEICVDMDAPKEVEEKKKRRKW